MGQSSVSLLETKSLDREIFTPRDRRVLTNFVKTRYFTIKNTIFPNFYLRSSQPIPYASVLFL